MIIEYKDGTQVELHLGDITPTARDTHMAWIHVNGQWQRCPFHNCNQAKAYLLSLESAADIDLLNIPRNFQKYLRG